MKNDQEDLPLEMAGNILSDSIYLCKKLGLSHKDPNMLQFVTTLIVSCEHQLQSVKEEKVSNCCHSKSSEYTDKINIVKGP